MYALRSVCVFKARTKVNTLKHIYLQYFKRIKVLCGRGKRGHISIKKTLFFWRSNRSTTIGLDCWKIISYILYLISDNIIVKQQRIRYIVDIIDQHNRLQSCHLVGNLFSDAQYHRHCVNANQQNVLLLLLNRSIHDKSEPDKREGATVPGRARFKRCAFFENGFFWFSLRIFKYDFRWIFTKSKICQIYPSIRWHENRVEIICSLAILLKRLIPCYFLFIVYFFVFFFTT